MNLAESLFPASVWHPHDVDFVSAQFRFVVTDREAFSRSTFLDHRAAFPGDRGFAVEFDVVRELLAPASASLPAAHFIFHHAFCGSTLITRCLA